MSAKKAFFFEREEMLANLREIPGEDPRGEDRTALHMFLAQFAGMEASERTARAVMMLAVRFAGFNIDLGRYLEAMLDDARTIEEAKRTLKVLVRRQPVGCK